MNYHLDKKEKSAQASAFIFTLLLHLVLLGGLYYINAEDPTAILPDFVIEWFNGNSAEKVSMADR